MRFALEVRQDRDAPREFATALTAQIRSLGGSVITNDETAPDIVVGVGGDGTMLAAVRQSLTWDVPVIGFNLGTIGFLTAAEAPDLEPAVQRLFTGDYDIDERTTVAATVGGVTELGVNDVVVEKVDSTRLVSLDVVIDGEPFVTYQADGLIVATPTGSTAYSFSAGGPLVDHHVDALVMTPVSTHSLFDRALVLPDTTTIEVTVSRDRQVKVNVDKTDLGQLDENETVTIRKGDRSARFVSLDGRTFSGLVKDKFRLL